MKNEKEFPWYSEFEKQGEDYVRQTFSDRDDEIGRSSRHWLVMKQVEREVAAADKRDDREERTLRIAERANRIAISAIIFSTIAAISSAVMSFIKTP